MKNQERSFFSPKTLEVLERNIAREEIICFVAIMIRRLRFLSPSGFKNTIKDLTELQNYMERDME